MDAATLSDHAAPLERGMTAADALRRLAGRALEAYRRALATLMHSEDPEGPHQARVALRRLRTHLRAARRLARDGALRPLEAEAREIFRRIGRLRDADVLLHDVGAGDPATLARLHADAARIRTEVRGELAACGAARFAETAAARLAATDWEGRRAGKPAAKAARRALDRAFDRLLAHGASLAALPDLERHELRKDLKTLRYLLDDYGPLWPEREVAPLRKRVRRLQDALGALNDLAMAEAQGKVAPEALAERRAAALATAEAEWARLRRGKRFW